MKTTLFALLFFLVISMSSKLTAQSNAQTNSEEKLKGWFLEINAGVQMSGIKDEDFIPSNYSPLINIVAGKWTGQWWGLQFGYKGLWFNAISDDIRHHYTFLYPELLIDANTFLTKRDKPRFWSLILHAGPGYFYNNHYRKPNICGNIGAQNQFRMSHRLSISIDIAAIVGWDIYQGDEDILPGTSIGLSYSF
jgi:hypothetical protein